MRHTTLFEDTVRISRWTLKSAACVLCFLAVCGLAAGQDRIRVSDAEAQKAVVHRENPAYPPMAKQMHVSGKVEVDVSVDMDGNVEKVDIVSGNALLASACTSAVKKWKFSPFQAGGKPAPAVARLSFDFTL